MYYHIESIHLISIQHQFNNFKPARRPSSHTVISGKQIKYFELRINL